MQLPVNLLGCLQATIASTLVDRGRLRELTPDDCECSFRLRQRQTDGSKPRLSVCLHYTVATP